MPPVIPQDVIAQALDLVEMESTTGASGFAYTTRVQDLFNRGLGKLHYILADGDLDWFSERLTISVSSGTAQYALPDGENYNGAPQFYRLKDLYLVKSGKVYVVPKYQAAEISGWEATGPQTNETLRMTYIPAYIPLERNEDGWADEELAHTYPAGWDDYVACFIAHRLSIRDEQYERAATIAAERDQALMGIMQHVAPRDVGRPDRVVDVTGRWQHDYQSAWTPNFAYRLFGEYLEIGQPGQVP